MLTDSEDELGEYEEDDDEEDAMSVWPTVMRDTSFMLQSRALDDDDDDIHLAQEESASLTIADVNAMCEARITQVQEVVGLTHDMALIVLLSREWSVDKCITELTEGQECVLRQVWRRHLPVSAGLSH